MRQLLITTLASQDLEKITDYFLEVNVDAGDCPADRLTPTLC